MQGRAKPLSETAMHILSGEVAAGQMLWETSRVAEGRVKVDARIIHGAPADPAGGGWFKPGEGKTEWFKDLDVGPEMVVVPAGTFMMGSKDSPGGADEHPYHKVTIAAPLAVGRFAVTFDEWDAAAAAGGVTSKPVDQGWGRGRRPVINVSWEDATAFCAWLSTVTGEVYRLLSEAEWEYCCRAGTATRYAFGDTIARSQAQFSEGEMGSAKQTVEVGKFPPNAWGLSDMHGNVGEYCEDNWHANYRHAPDDGSVWKGKDILHVNRGGSWRADSTELSSSRRNWASTRNNYTGFRVTRRLVPHGR